MRKIYLLVTLVFISLLTFAQQKGDNLTRSKMQPNVFTSFATKSTQSIASYNIDSSPYTMGFESGEDYSDWGVIDQNQDDTTWSIYADTWITGANFAGYSYSVNNIANDVFVTPLFELVAGETYEISFKYRVGDASYPEKLAIEVYSEDYTTHYQELIDLGAITNTSPLTQTLEFSVPTSATYLVAFVCYSDANQWMLAMDDFSIEKTSTGLAPVAEFTGTPTSITAGNSVNFNDQSSNSPTSWSWNFGDGQSSTSQNPSHVYSSAGTYTVSLTTTNAYGSNTKTRTNYITVTAAGSAPVANFTGTPTNIIAGNSVSFTDQSSNTPTSWSWNFGDGGSATNYNPTHTYTTAGTYNVSLTVTNSFGTDTKTKNGYITVTEAGPEPLANFSASKTSNIRQTESITFTDESTNNPTSWSWNFGDGASSTAQNPAHSYTTVGTYTVSLTATNQYGSTTETKIDYIYVSSNEVYLTNLAFYDESVLANNGMADYYDGLPTSIELNPSNPYNLINAGNRVRLNVKIILIMVKQLFLENAV